MIKSLLFILLNLTALCLGVFFASDAGAALVQDPLWSVLFKVPVFILSVFGFGWYYRQNKGRNK